MTQPMRDPETILGEQLVQFDEALAEAGIPPVLETFDDPELQRRFERAQACLQFLELDRRRGIESTDTPSLQWTIRQEAVSRSGPAEKLVPLDQGHHIGRFKLIRRLGSGGFGVVYLADDPVLHRLVALKIPRPETIATPDLQRRFVRESQIAAKLTHPHLVPIYEAGQAGAISYQVTEYCAGGTLSSWLCYRDSLDKPVSVPKSKSHPSDYSLPSEQQAEPSQHRLPINVAVELMIGLAEGVHHAHEHGILHRDLKPTNILLRPKGEPSGKTASTSPGSVALTELCRAFTPLVADFGLARLVEDRDEASQTSSGHLSSSNTTLMAGTPQYMSPEQLDGRWGKIGPAADIYGLGAVLHELLTGRHAVVHLPDDPLDGKPAFGKLQVPGCPRDLEAICVKCLEPQISERYASAKELARDLHAFNRGEPVIARPWPWHERLAKWSRRRPAVASLLLLTVCLFVGFLAFGVWHLNRLSELNAQLVSTIAERELQTLKAVSQSQRADKQAKLADEKSELALQQSQRSEALAWIASQREYAANMLRSVEFWQSQQLAPMASILQRYLPRTDQPENDPRGFEWRHLFAMARRIRNLAGHTHQIKAAALTSDGKTCYSISRDSTMRRWDTQYGKLQQTWQLPDLGDEEAIEINEQCTRAIFAIADTNPRQVVVWDLPAGKELFRKRLDQFDPEQTSISPDGQWAVIAGSRLGGLPMVAILDLTSGEMKQCVIEGRDPLTYYGVFQVTISPNGKELAVCLGHMPPNQTWAHRIIKGKVLPAKAPSKASSPLPDLGAWELVKKDTPGACHKLVFSPDGRRISVATGRPYRLEVLNWPDCKLVNATPELDGQVDDFAFDELGENVILSSIKLLNPADANEWNRLTSSMGNSSIDLKVWSYRNGSKATTAFRLSRQASCLRYHAPSSSWIVGDFGGRLMLWDRQAVPPYVELKGHSPREAWCLAFAADGRTLYTGGDDGCLRGWDLETCRETFGLEQHTALVSCMAMSPDGHWIATGSYSRDIALWQTNPLKVHAVLNGHANDIRCIAFSPDSRTLASGGRDQTVRRWSIPEGKLLKSHDDPSGGTVKSIAFSSNDQFVAAHGAGRIQAWGPEGKPKVIRSEESEIQCLAVSPSGVNWRWDATSSDALTTPLRKTSPGDLLLYGRKHGEVKLLHLPSGEIWLEHHHPALEIRSVAFSPDGRNFAFSDNERSIHIWHLFSGQEILTFSNLPAPANQIAFSPSGDALAAALHDGTIRIWNAPFVVPTE